MLSSCCVALEAVWRCPHVGTRSFWNTREGRKEGRKESRHSGQADERLGQILLRVYLEMSSSVLICSDPEQMLTPLCPHPTSQIRGSSAFVGLTHVWLQKRFFFFLGKVHIIGFFFIFYFANKWQIFGWTLRLVRKQTCQLLEAVKSRSACYVHNENN